MSNSHRPSMAVCGGLGLLAMAYACWRPRGWLFVLGLLVVAVVVGAVVRRALQGRVQRRWAPAGGAVLGVVLALVVGVAVPMLAARPSVDATWSLPRHSLAATGADCPNLADGPRILWCGEEGTQGIDAASGRIVRQAPPVHQVTGSGGMVVVDSSGIRRYDPDGTMLWDSSTIDNFPDGEAIAARGDATVLLRCSNDKPWPCDVTGVGRSGSVTWHRHLTQVDAMFGPPGGSRRALRLPSTVALRYRTGDGRVLTILDPRTGNVVGDHRLPEEVQFGYHTPHLIGDQVVTSFSGHRRGGCTWTVYEGGHQLWSHPEPCAENGNAGPLYRVTKRWLYIGARGAEGPTLAVIDRTTGRSRVLGPDEARVQHPDDRTRLFHRAHLVGDEVIISFVGDQLVGTDPATGDRLWSRTAPAPHAEVINAYAGTVAVLADPPNHNPLVNQRLDGQDRRSGYDSWRWATAITVLNPRTGVPVAQAYEPGGVHEPLPVGAGLFVVPHDPERPAYLLGSPAAP